MKLLVLSTVDPCPPSDGVRIPVYELVARLSARHDVTLATFVDPTIDRPSEYAHFYANLAGCIRLPIRGRRSVFNPREWPALLSGLPASVFPYVSRDAAAMVAEVLSRNHIDAAVCHLVHPAALLPDAVAARSCIVVQDVLHNVISTGMAHEPRRWKRVYSYSQATLMKVYERRQYGRFAARSVVSVAEQRRAEELGVGTVRVIPNGVGADFFASRGCHREHNRLLYLGALDAPRNEHAAWRLATDILPLIRRSCPTVQLDIVGRRPSRRLLALASSSSSITVTGQVPSVVPYLDRASVCVSPQVTGTGLKNSLLQAMASGVPVVGTPQALEGLTGTPDRDYLLAESPAAIAVQVVALLRNPDRAERIAASARSLVEQSYSWDAYTESIEGLLSPIIHGAS